MGCFIGGINRQNRVEQNSTWHNTTLQNKTYDFYIACKAAHPTQKCLLGRWHELSQNIKPKNSKQKHTAEYFMLPTEQISHQVYLVGSRNTAKKIISSHNREQRTTVKYSTFYCLLSTFGSCTKTQADYSEIIEVYESTKQYTTAQNITYQILLQINPFKRLYKQKTIKNISF